MADILVTNYDTSKIFLFGNQSMLVSYTNSTGAPVTLVGGRVMGRVRTSQKVLPQVSTATDGSQYPMGIVMHDYEVANGATVDIWVVDSGNVAEEKLIFSGAETLATSIGTDVSIRDGLLRVGIRPIPSTELSLLDTQ